jgi:hypothetical protein
VLLYRHREGNITIKTLTKENECLPNLPLLNPLKELLYMSRTNKLVVPQSEAVLEQMKQEIAQEFGINYGADATARENGKIGGEITRRLVQMAQEQLKQ